MSKFWICPSILSADWSQLGNMVQQALNAGADRIHFDIMDHHYVPNLTLGPKLCTDLRAQNIIAPFDVHLMVDPVDPLILAFSKAGATCISIHPKTSLNVKHSIDLIHQAHCEAGLVLNPDEPIELITPHLHTIERILIMSVYPGFGGQSFIPSVLEKAKSLRDIIRQNALSVRLEIDGGITDKTIALAAAAGVDTFVSGSYIFDAPDINKQIQKLRLALR